MNCPNCGSDEGTLLTEFDSEKSYSWGELAEMTESCVSCGEVVSPKALWKKLGDIPTNDDDEIEEAFLNFPSGTNRFKIWQWFEVSFDISIAQDLMGLE